MTFLPWIISIRQIRTQLRTSPIGQRSTLTKIHDEMVALAKQNQDT